jgi:hypothetical protein
MSTTAISKSPHQKLYSDDEIQVWKNGQTGEIEIGLTGVWKMRLNKHGVGKSSWVSFEKRQP